MSKCTHIHIINDHNDYLRKYRH